MDGFNEQHQTYTFAATVVVGVLSVWYVVSRRGRRKPVVTDLFYYPIKSCAGTRVSEAEFNRLGLKYDRQWVIVTPAFENKTTSKKHFKFMSARECPKMVLVYPSIVTEGGVDCLRIEAEGMKSITVPATPSPHDSETCSLEVWADTMHASIYMGEEICNWLEKYFKKECYLCTVLSVEQHHRPLPRDSEHSNRTGSIQAGAFADGFPFLLTSEESLADLNTRLQKKGVDKMKMDRFRPNIIIKGVRPWGEDEFKKIKIGNEIFDSVKPCGRCSMPSVDPATGKYHKRFEPTPTLRSFRKVMKDGDEELLFGVNLVQTAISGRLCVGSKVEVLESKGGPPLVK
eukprot:Nk52_evm17s292 gene=Nk52_evmTU17s292